jgi:hypothetical protein
LITRPQSCVMAIFSTFTRPVSTSTSTIAAYAAFE